MMWNGYGGGWGMALMMLSQVLFWGLLIVGVVYLVRTLGTGKEPNTAERILAERYARGEIEEDEYRRRLSAIRHG